jgi:hypothetical protein
VKPGKHWQSKAPTSLLQIALGLQGAPDAHSLTSMQLTPFPVKPAIHTQLKLPGLSTQFA